MWLGRFFAAIVLFWPIAALAQSPCQLRGIETLTDDNVRYRDRGGWCEGLFKQPVSASANLAVIGLHRHQPKFAPNTDAPLTVSTLIRPGAPGIQIRAVSTRPRLYYLMNASLNPSGRFVWQRTILSNSQVRLLAHEVKVLGCVGSCDQKEPRLVPVSIAEGPLTDKGTGATIWLRAGLDLKQLFVTVDLANGKKPLINGDILNQRVLPAGVPIDTFLNLPPGQYKLRAVAVPAQGSAMDEYRAVITIP